MFPHWQYVLEDLLGPITSVYARNATHLTQRWDESGQPYTVTADDAAYAVLEFGNGALGSVNSSWAVRVNRRELLEIQVDGTHGSAVAGLRNCAAQHRVNTPMPVWNPDLPDPIDYQALWLDVPDTKDYGNGFKVRVGAVPGGGRGGRAVPLGPGSRHSRGALGQPGAAILGRKAASGRAALSEGSLPPEGAS